jgi:hypothetical protein
VQEGKKGTTDLVALFKEVCRMEERFREEIKRYVRTPGAKRITPREIPPMIAVSGSLPPTAGNKMFNARLASKNFGGRWSMLTLAPKRPETMEKNVETLNVLLTSSAERGLNVLGGVTSKQKSITASTYVFEATNAQLVAFLKAYRWLEDDYKYPEQPTDASLQIEFLEQQKHGITSWLIIAPQRKVSFGAAEKVGKSGKLAVKERQRDEGRNFQVFGEPDHRKIAEFLAGIEPEPDKSKLTSPNTTTASFHNLHRGVCLLYLVREEPLDRVSVGFELLFPDNQLPFDTNFTVRRKSESTRIIVTADEADNPTQ